MRPPWEDPSRVLVWPIGAAGFPEGRDQPSAISTRWVRITASTTHLCSPLTKFLVHRVPLSAGRVGVAGSKFVASSESLPVQATFRVMCVHCAPAAIRSLRWEWMVVGNPPLDVTGTTRGHFVSRSPYWIGSPDKSYTNNLLDTIGAGIVHLSVAPLFSPLAHFHAEVGWKSPFQHLNPPSVEIYTFGRGMYTIRKSILS